MHIYIELVCRKGPSLLHYVVPLVLLSNWTIQTCVLFIVDSECIFGEGSTVYTVRVHMY